MIDKPIAFFEVELKQNRTSGDTFIVAYGFWIPLPLLVSPQGKGWVGDFNTKEEAEIQSSVVALRWGGSDIVSSLLVQDLLHFEDGGLTIPELRQEILKGLFDVSEEEQPKPNSPRSECGPSSPAAGAAHPPVHLQ